MTDDKYDPISDPMNTDKPNVARMYDYLLDGHQNFPADREMANKLLTILPHLKLTACVSRAFLRRSVNFLIEQGIDQFLDIGSGLPTIGNVHEVARRVVPDAKVVYVDIDPVAVEHSRAILVDTSGAIAIQADASQPEVILNHPDVQKTLDFDRPIGLLLLTVLHYIVDDEKAYGAVETLTNVLAPGSYIAITHGSAEMVNPQEEELFKTSGSNTVNRSMEDVSKFFKGFELVEPGIVPTPLWHPENENDALFHEPEKGYTWAAVGRKDK